MVPKLLQKINHKTRTPVNGTIFVAIVVALLAGLVSLSKLADLSSIGTLTAFCVVSAAVIILRRTAPDLPRGFRVPFYPWVPIASIVFSLLVVHWPAEDHLRHLRNMGSGMAGLLPSLRDQALPARAQIR